MRLYSGKQIKQNFDYFRYSVSRVKKKEKYKHYKFNKNNKNHISVSNNNLVDMINPKHKHHSERQKQMHATKQ